MDIVKKIFEILGYVIKAIFKIPSWLLTFIAKILKIDGLIGKASGWKSIITATAITIAGFAGSLEPTFMQLCDFGLNWFCEGGHAMIVMGLLFGVLRVANEDIKPPDWL